MIRKYIPKYKFQEKETSQEGYLTLCNRKLKKKSFSLIQLCMFKNLSSGNYQENIYRERKRGIYETTKSILIFFEALHMSKNFGNNKMSDDRGLVQ